MNWYRNITSLLLQVITLLFCFCGLIYGQNVTAVISTEYGPVRGLRHSLKNGNIAVKFLGIPYATASRFERPRNPAKWTQTLDAVNPKVCPQTGEQVVDENCLTLNVYKPSATRNSSLPVLVFIHGGAFMRFSAHEDDPSLLATEQGIMVVTINYRLGILGFLCSGDIKENLGLLDQIYALKWVQNNIERFGGDRSQVTIGGLSAGGESASILMLSPLATGLFTGVFAMSGTPVPTLEGRKDVETAARRVAEVLGCIDVGQRITDCLREKSTAEIVSAMQNVSMKFAPCVDGHVIPSTSALGESRELKKLNVMMGATNDEGSFQLHVSPDLSRQDLDHGISRQTFTQYIRNQTWITGQTNQVSHAIEQVYTDWSNEDNANKTRESLVDVITDHWIVVPTVTTLRACAKAGARTFFYFFEKKPPVERKIKGITQAPGWFRATHGADNSYLFGGDLDMTWVNDSLKADREFAKRFRTFIANFVKTGDPNGATVPTWPQFTPVHQQYVSMDSQISLGSNLRADKVHFWNKFLPSLTSSDPPSQEPPTDKPEHHVKRRDKVVIALALTSVIFIVVAILLFIMLLYTCIKTIRLARVAKGGYSAELVEKDGNTETT
ncbi:carboxylesterase 5A [Nematostella vectensis]|uniref:carboxylesterase 5A n=1 Tax=Nematostella vectensis TaxID=45351 RepID=UPI00138F9FC7|nr:carboxylesterase 5A [Nematostella vectensis]